MKKKEHSAMSTNSVPKIYAGRRTIHRRRRKIWIPVLLAVLAAAGLTAAFLLGPGARPVMEGGSLGVCMSGSGEMTLRWPAAKSADVYRLYLDNGEERGLAGTVTENKVTLSGVKENEPLKVEIRGVAHGKNFLGMDREMESVNAISATVIPRVLPAPAVDAHISGESMVDLSWLARGGENYEVVALEDEQGSDMTPVTTVTGGSARVVFGDMTPMPEEETPTWLAVRTAVAQEGCTLYSACSPAVQVSKEMLLGKELLLNAVQTEQHTCRLRWNETQGDYYELQEWTAATDKWTILARVSRGEALEYETGTLDSGAYYRFRVLSYYNTVPKEPVDLRNPTYAATPGEASFRAELSPLYCTVWPVIALELRSQPGGGDKLGSIPEGTTLCVLEENGEYFKVRYKDQYGYVASDYCLINLPEYIGDVCEYDITNSYKSIFKVHQYPMQDITDTVIRGFEHVNLGEDGYLVPYLYPCVEKLLAAAGAAEKDGYKFRIYEAFRPHTASRYLFETAGTMLDSKVPKLDYKGRMVDEATGFSIDAEKGYYVDASSGTDIYVGLISDGPPDGGAPVDNTVDDGRPTYYTVMTDNRYNLGSFLAAGVSTHNRGIALDLTLVSIESDRALSMQTEIHDLSWYASTEQNNENAELLASYLKGAGMNGLVSEWWHFQDDETRERIKLNGYLTAGVSPEGWTMDDTGWRYRLADGSYYRSTTETIDGKEYTFNQAGYTEG